ncbi:MAG: 2-amino-4-hydroxy-6-hydroxymethyldihydropteridine diphosphokinase [Prevotella sp.]|nr:2-amino-4-hydroxy-6-hydroxymethyldihydropteridine diphosphokinase [Prevotella sp.]
MEHRVYLGLGSNMGRREENLRRAVLLIGERVGEVLRQSSVLETEPWGYESDHKFLNAVILCQTELSPRQLLQAVKQIERDMGRVTKSKACRYADRPIDIDILLYDNLTVDDPDLKIPHPLMHERDFVMIPLNEIYE